MVGIHELIRIDRLWQQQVAFQNMNFNDVVFDIKKLFTGSNIYRKSQQSGISQKDNEAGKCNKGTAFQGV